MSLTLLLALPLLGAFTGLLAGLFGVGGGMILTPFLTMLLSLTGQFPPETIVHIALATSMGTIVFTSASSFRAHAQHGAVEWKAFYTLMPGIILGGLLGAQITGALPTFWIALIFTIFVTLSATKIFVTKKQTKTRDLPTPLGLTAWGTGIGTVAAIVGAGGGFMIVPFLTWCRVSIHTAIGTSAALGLPVSIAGTLGYIWAGLNRPELEGISGLIGFIYWPALIAVALCSIFTAPLGASIAHKMESRRLRQCFAVLLYSLGVYMLYKGVMSL